MVPRKLVLASPRGYCAGVDRAVDTVERALEHFGAPVYVRKEIVHNRHVVSELADRGAVFVDSELDVPEGGAVVLSAHGVAPEVYRNSKTRGLRVLDATCPLVSKVHAEARRYAARGYTIVLIGHEGHEEVVGTMGEAPGVDPADRLGRGDRRPRRPRPRAGRLHHPDDAVGRRDARDHRRAPAAIPGRDRARQGRHLLRHPEPPERGQGAGPRGRPRPRHRVAQLLELEPARRRHPRDGRRGAPDRRRVGHRPRLAGRGRHRRHHVGRVGARVARRRGSSSISARSAPSSSSRTSWSTRTSTSRCRSSCAGRRPPSSSPAGTP